MRRRWRTRFAGSSRNPIAGVRRRATPPSMFERASAALSSRSNSMRSIATSHVDGVSVVVPVRNGAPWLARVLDALLDEDPGVRYEIIAIDDGSTDGSSGILARFNRDPRVRVIDGPGRGATAALNLGLALAQCASIAQVDQDVV